MDGLAIPLSNLADSTARIAREGVRRLGHLSELTYAAVSEIRAAGEGESPRTLFSSASLLGLGGVEAKTAEDRAAVVRALLGEAVALFGHPISAAELADGPRPPLGRARTVYVRNPLTDRAYAALSPLLSSPTVGHRQNFRELFDDVENGYADYAVLPLFAGGRPIGSVALLLEERALYVTATANISTEEDEVTFALLSREPVAHRSPTRFLFRFAAEETAELAMLLEALPALGLSLLQLDAAPLPYEGGGMSCRLLLAGEDFAPILVYLALYAPSFTSYGFYIELQ